MRSFGDWLAPRAGISDITKDLRHAIIEIVSKHGLHHVARGAWAVQSRSPFMQDKHNDKILEATKSFVQVAAPHPGPVHSSRPAVSLWAHPTPVAAHARPRHWPHRHGRVRFPHGRFRTNTVLIQEDIDAKFVQEFQGNIAQGKTACLCSDSTIANVNAKVQIEEKSFNPCVEDITSSKVVSHPSEGWLHDRRQ